MCDPLKTDRLIRWWHRLAGHYASLDAATSSLKNALGTDRSSSASDGPPLFSSACRNLIVGKARSYSTSVLSAFSDRLEYVFHHDQHGPVQMLMRFRDVDQASLSSRTLSFHVNRPLRHFGIEYDPSRKGEVLSLDLCSDSDAAEFRRVVGHFLSS